VPNFENLLKLLVILNDNYVALGTFGNVLASVGQIRRINSRREPATQKQHSAASQM